MIKVNIKDNQIKVLGHALYDDYGRDIVCASVSSIVITSVNAIMSFDKEAINYEEIKDGLIINILKHDKVTKTLIDNMINLLKELSSQYEENIEVIGG